MNRKLVEGFPHYWIYDDGRLYSEHTHKFLAQFEIGRKEYPYLAYKLCLDGFEKTEQVHRLVANAFIPNPDNLATVNHIDGNKFNNHVSNLEWMTQQENKASAFELGISVAWWQGDIHSRSTFTNEEVHRICAEFQRGVKPLQMAPSTTKLYQKLFRIYDRDNWKSISQHYNW